MTTAERKKMNKTRQNNMRASRSQTLVGRATANAGYTRRASGKQAGVTTQTRQVNGGTVTTDATRENVASNAMERYSTVLSNEGYRRVNSMAELRAATKAGEKAHYVSAGGAGGNKIYTSDSQR